MGKSVKVYLDDPLGRPYCLVKRIIRDEAGKVSEKIEKVYTTRDKAKISNRNLVRTYLKKKNVLEAVKMTTAKTMTQKKARKNAFKMIIFGAISVALIILLYVYLMNA